MARDRHPRGGGRRRIAPWDPTASREAIRRYLQERMRLYFALMFVAFWVLVGFVFALYQFYPRARPADVYIVHWVAVCGLSIMGGIWYFVLYRGAPSVETLYWIDSVCTVLIGATFAFSAYFSADREANVYSSFIWSTFTVFARVLVVPSSGRRTMWVASLAMAPLVVAAVAIHAWKETQLPGPALIVGSVVFVGTAVVLATTGSRVIYGLRKQVTAAQHLGQYTLGEKIGGGGMGEVYKAEHAMLRRPTAVKLLPPERYGEESVKRFEREVQHTSQLTHPNTIAIYDYGRSPDGVFYYAMEYLDGIDLETLVHHYGPQPAGRVARILAQACGALEEAHSSGLIHRDIKPANIVLCERGGVPDVVKVVDFGLVKDISADPGISAQTVAGTPAYISPEGVTDPLHIGPASDLYSLGAVGYHLLTGTPPFGGESEVAVCVQHVRAKPEPPSQRTENPMSSQLESLILRCLEKGPSRRPASALELRDALLALPDVGEWDDAVAGAWWRSYRERARLRPVEASPEPTETAPVSGPFGLDDRSRVGDS